MRVYEMKYICITFALLLFVGFIIQPALSKNVDEGIVAYWGLNEEDGETAKDDSGNGHDGKLLGDPQWTKEGYFGGALEFDQVGDEVNVPFHKDLNQESFSVCAWANVEPGSANHRAVVSCRDAPPLSGYIFYAEPGNTWQYWTGDGSWVSVQGPKVNLGDWDHLTGTYADGVQKFYVNGEFVGERNSKIIVNTRQEFLIGAGGNEFGAHQYLFKGRIDEVRLYDRPLDEDEIEAVMKSEGLAVEAFRKIAVKWGQLKAK